MGEGMTWIYNGMSQSLSTGFSWANSFANSFTGPGSSARSWFGEGTVLGSLFGGLSNGMGIGAALWSVGNGAGMVSDGWKSGNKTKMAVGTLTMILAGTELVPQTFKTAMSDYLGGFGGIIGTVAKTIADPNNAMLVNNVLNVSLLSVGSGMKKLVGDDLALDEEGVAAVFAVATMAGNAFDNGDKDLTFLTKVLPYLGKLVPYWSIIKDQDKIVRFLRENATHLSGYVAAVSAATLKNANISLAKMNGNNVIINAPLSGGNRKARRKRLQK